MKLIASSILSANFANLGDEINAVEASGVDFIHIDVMDGIFVPNITFGSLIVNTIKKLTSLPIDVHFMVKFPELYIDDFILAGADSIFIHQEVCEHLHRIIQQIKSRGIKIGIALNPATSLEQIKLVLEMLDFVLIMSVDPGFGGQKFIDMILDKINVLRRTIDVMGLKTLIQVDGGVNINNIARIMDAGADIFVVGSCIFNSNNYDKVVKKLKFI